MKKDKTYNPKVSIIIPVYNVEKYLNKCIKSIVNQTYKSLEIILIDDGSPDNCPKMCDEWAKKDKRIKVVHKENGGQGSARNIALDICHGDYICFVDSDDWVEENYVELLLKTSLENDADISICKIKSIDEESHKTEDITPFYETILGSGNNLVYDAYNKQEILSHSPCNKLYKKEIFKKLRFPEIRMCEDSAIYLYTFHLSKKYVAIPIVLYNYLIHKGSTMRKAVTVERVNSVLKQFDFCIDFLTSNNYKSLLYNEIVSCLSSCIGQYIRAREKDLKKYIKKQYIRYKNEYKDIVNFKNAPLKLKLKMIFMKVF